MRARRRQPRALVLPYLLSSVSSRYNEKRRGFPRRSLRCARKILAEFPREPVGSRFPNQRPFELLVLPERFTPALRRVYAAGRCSRSLSRFAPDFLGESGPFCPICLGLSCWLRPLSAFAVFNFQTDHAMGLIPTRVIAKAASLRIVMDEQKTFTAEYAKDSRGIAESDLKIFSRPPRALRGHRAKVF